MKSLSRYLSPLALLAWGVLMLYFYGSGRLNQYLIPAYRPGVLVAGVLMLGIAASQLWALRFGAGWQSAAGLIADDCADEVATPGRVWVTQLLAFGMLVVPMWAAVAVSKDGYNASAMLNRGVVTDVANLPGKSAAPAKAMLAASQIPAPLAPQPDAIPEPPLPGATPIPPDNSPLDASQYLKKTADGHVIAEVTDLLFASEDDQMRPAFEGKTVELTGQFMPARNAPDDRFQIVRMFMVCCAADARPIAIAVLPPRAGAPGTAAAKLPVEMSWTRVTGTVEFPLENGRRVPIIHAQSAVACDPPSESMLY